MLKYAHLADRGPAREDGWNDQGGRGRARFITACARRSSRYCRKEAMPTRIAELIAGVQDDRTVDDRRQTFAY